MANFRIIRDLCEKNKITIRELASRVGIKENAIHKIIQNNSTNTTTIEEIARVFEVPVGYFFDDSPLSSINQNIKGNKNATSVYGDASISECESKLEIAQNKIENLEALLEEKERLMEEKERTMEEKERTIQILMKK